MNEDRPDGPTGDRTGDPEAAAARRRRRERVFGEVLPESTSDDRDPGAGRGEGGHEEWLRRNVPPHHG